MGKILTAQEVAELLEVSKQTIYRLVRANEIPHFRVGKTVRFNEETITAWINGEI